MTARLDAALAARMARSTLGHLGREYPNKLDHVLEGPEDVAGPQALHPIFFGSFDWHSCVHGWWQVMRLARLFPDMPVTAEIVARADAMLTAEKAAGEMAYLARASASFERPYGWAWLLALHDELTRHAESRWAEAIAPLAGLIADGFRAYLPKLLYPVRHGAHGNTAFALILAHDWAVWRDSTLAALIAARANDWFGGDADAQAWEPSGEDFLSPILCEAVLMQRVLPEAVFADWLARFLPDPRTPRARALLTPAIVSDRGDGKLAHLDGLNLSRAWCWRALSATPGLADVAERAAEDHLAASLAHLADDYMGEHWLATFAMLATG